MRSEAEIRRAELIVHLPWMIRRNMPEVLEIEQLCFDRPWTADDFLLCLRNRNCIGKVATHGQIKRHGSATDLPVVGFVIYELHKTRLDILNLAVHPSCQRRGVGRQLLWDLIAKLSRERRTRLTLLVKESNTDAHLFLQAMGFRCVNVMRDYYDDIDEAAYLFQYRLPREAAI